MVTAVLYRDANPPYLFPAYDSTVYRAPREPLIEAPPGWLRDAPGPDFRRIPVPADGADLHGRRSGKPIGERIVVAGRVLGSDGRPVPATLVEMWQANAAGVYEDPSDPGFFPRDPNFTGAGRCLTDMAGRFRFRTIKPGAYPRAPGQIYRPSHIHLSVFGPTLGSRLITQCYFEGDPLIGWDPIAHSSGDLGVRRLTAQLDPEVTQSEGGQCALSYDHDVVLRASIAAGARSRQVTTPSQTIGPRYGYALMFEGADEAVSPAEAGAVEIHGTVLDGRGEKVGYPDAMLELWVADQFARTRTNADGEYRAVLRKPPAGLLPGGQPLAAHVNVTVFACGLLKQVQTRMYFPDEEWANAADPVLSLIPRRRRPALVARREGGRLRFDIHLQGNDETPFFAF